MLPKRRSPEDSGGLFTSVQAVLAASGGEERTAEAKIRLAVGCQLRGVYGGAEATNGLPTRTCSDRYWFRGPGTALPELSRIAAALNGHADSACFQVLSRDVAGHG